MRRKWFGRKQPKDENSVANIAVNCAAQFYGAGLREVLQLCSHPVIGWQDAPPGIFGLWFIQVAAI